MRAEWGQSGGRVGAEWGQSEGRMGAEWGQSEGREGRVGAEWGQSEGRVGAEWGQSVRMKTNTNMSHSVHQLSGSVFSDENLRPVRSHPNKLSTVLLEHQASIPIDLFQWQGGELGFTYNLAATFFGSHT